MGDVSFLSLSIASTDVRGDVAFSQTKGADAIVLDKVNEVETEIKKAPIPMETLNSQTNGAYSMPPQDKIGEVQNAVINAPTDQTSAKADELVLEDLPIRRAEVSHSEQVYKSCAASDHNKEHHSATPPGSTHTANVCEDPKTVYLST